MIRRAAEEPTAAPAELPPALRAHNPFTDNRVAGTASADADVAAVHAAAFQRLTELAAETVSAGRGLGVVLWGEAGVGKSHLLARLGRWAADGRAVFVPLHNLQAAPERLPASVLRAVVGLLTLGRTARFAGTPLYHLAHAGALAAVDGHPGRIAWPRLQSAYAAWLDRRGAAGLPLFDRTPYEVLYRFFRSAERATRGRGNGADAALAVRWLSGSVLDAAECRSLDLPPPGRLEDAAPDAERARHVLVTLSHLAACKGRPFILAFDQVDNLDEEQFAALARFLEALIDAAPNLLVVTAGVQSTLQDWTQRRVVQESAWDRLAQSKLQVQRVRAAEAVQIVRARLDAFLAPWADTEDVRRLRAADPLFPLGRAWQERALGGKDEVRPRDAVNAAREGWRHEQDELARLGDEWLATWAQRQGIEPPQRREATPEEVQAAVDQATEEWMAKHAARRRREAGGLPPDADQLAGLVYALLRQCEEDERARILGLMRVQPPRVNRRPLYDVDLRQRGPGGADVRTGIAALAEAHGNAITAVLRRLTEEAPPLDRLFLVTDKRLPLRLGAKGQEYFDRLRNADGRRFRHFEIALDEYLTLDALRAVEGQADSGELEADLPTGPRPVTAADVRASHRRRGRYLRSELLRAVLFAEESVSADGSTTA